ncbi:MAG: tRNA threonylcarbamoyladenosine dehydratase [Verrucomicrobia bacterium]|nr:tRNA threonylcarbamoyladenosine dehydratase [Verrucomicrobiota bacterium]
MNRFARTEMLLGAEGLARLRDARVLVAGLGAVGSYAVEGLARAGIGHLRLVDFDIVQPSNINRQLFALESTLGRPKVEVAAARILDINPGCDVDARRTFIDAATAPDLLAGGVDAVIDAIDSLGPKVALLRAAHQAGVWTVSCMGAATRTDPMAVRIGDLASTERCPLARFVRKRLRRDGIVSGIRCVYSLEPPPPPAPFDADPEPVAPGLEHRRGRKRRPLGSLSTLTGMFGLSAATEVILHLAAPR